MAKTILFAAAFLILGALVGNGVERYSVSQHKHTRAVMNLAAFHSGRLSDAAKAGQCPTFVAERERLFRISDELLDAFPKAYAEDTEFHKRADALRAAIHPANGTGSDCGTAVADAKKIDDACDDCHREYN